jgi:ATP synthase protein I
MAVQARRMQTKARRVISAQVLITAAAAVLLHFWQGPVVALSAGIGGAIGFVPAWLYAWKMGSGGSDPRDLLRAQYKAEFYKFAATALMFALTFVLFREVAALYLFLTYFATLAVYWVALVMG